MNFAISVVITYAESGFIRSSQVQLLPVSPSGEGRTIHRAGNNNPVCVVLPEGCEIITKGGLSRAVRRIWRRYGFPGTDKVGGENGRNSCVVLQDSNTESGRQRPRVDSRCSIL